MAPRCAWNVQCGGGQWILGPSGALGGYPGIPESSTTEQGQMPRPAISWTPKPANKMIHARPSLFYQMDKPRFSPRQTAAEHPPSYWRSLEVQGAQSTGQRDGPEATQVQFQVVASTFSLHIYQMTYCDRWAGGRQADSASLLFWNTSNLDA